MKGPLPYQVFRVILFYLFIFITVLKNSPSWGQNKECHRRSAIGNFLSSTWLQSLRLNRPHFPPRIHWRNINFPIISFRSTSSGRMVLKRIVILTVANALLSNPKQWRIHVELRVRPLLKGFCIFNINYK